MVEMHFYYRDDIIQLYFVQEVLKIFYFLLNKYCINLDEFVD